MTAFTRRQSKHVKKSYRVRNWKEYESGLRSRGSLTVWIDVDEISGTIPGWNAPPPARRRPGRRKKYSNVAIETSRRLSMVYHLASRQTEGFMRSIFALLNLNADVPDHSTVSKRSAKLGKIDVCERHRKQPVHLIIDSSGLEVHVGQLRKPPRRRDYRKLHLGVDERTGDVIACELTSKRARDAARVPALLRQIDRPIASAKADSAYDSKAVYEAMEAHREDRTPRVLIPPRKNARLHPESPSWSQRNRTIRSRTRLGNRAWHTRSGYSRRCLGETAFARYKVLIGPSMRARKLAAQRVEARLGCQILNKMAALGMPDSYMVG